MKNIFLLLIAFFTFNVNLFAQGDRKDKAPVTYEELYDEPYSVNKLFVMFQPLYGELFVTNVNAGFGAELSYYLGDKADFKASLRKTYSSSFFDFSRHLARNNGDVDNLPAIFNYYELGGTYHVKDFEVSSKTKMFLYKKSYRGARWASRMPLNAEIPCKVRKVIGARVGGIMWDSSTDLNRALKEQGLTNNDLKDAEGNGLPISLDDGGTERPLEVFSNVATQNVYIGGSMSWIKNVAVNFDGYEEGMDDLILTAFLDVLYAPTITLDDVIYTHKDPNSPVAGTRTYSVSPIKLQNLGFRAGIEGKFNRTLGWAYGGELGYRPGIAGRGFYLLIKISFPVYGTDLDYQVESFGK